jgi:hypothetical protein
MNPPELGPRDEVKTQQAALFHVRQLDTPKTKTLRPSQNQSLPRLPWYFPWFQLIFHDFPRIFRFSNPFEVMIPRWVGATRHASPGWRFADSILGFQQPAELAPGLLRRCELSGPFRAGDVEVFEGKMQHLGGSTMFNLYLRGLGEGRRTWGWLIFFGTPLEVEDKYATSPVPLVSWNRYSVKT